MDMRPIGQSGLQASVLSFGALTFTGKSGVHAVFGGLDQSEASRMIDICLAEGVTLFDTADMYSDGVAEELLGAALGARRKQALIATKGFARTGPGEYDIGLSRRHLVAACEASLRRLATDCIDLYQLHEFDALTPIDETLHALDDLVRAGKIRRVGCSNFAGWQFLKALAMAAADALPRFASHQVYYSLLCRDVENDVLPAALDQDVGVLVWGPLASGYLSGKFRRGAPAPQGSRIGAVGDMDLFDPTRADDVVDVVRAIAEARGATPSQVSLNWLLRKPAVTSVIVGARTEAQLRDNLGAADWRLTRAEVDRLDAVSAPRLPFPLSHQRSVYAIERNPIAPNYRD